MIPFLANVAAAREWCIENDVELLFPDDLDEAFVGIAMQAGTAMAVYDECRALALLEHEARNVCEARTHAGCLHDEDAWEWYAYNTTGAWLGRNTWAFVELCVTVQRACDNCRGAEAVGLAERASGPALCWMCLDQIAFRRYLEQSE